jgi:hypothetical protein
VQVHAESLDGAQNQRQKRPKHRRSQIQQQQQRQGITTQKEKRTNYEDQGTRKSSRHHKQKKYFPITRCGAWMAANVIGRAITSADYLAYNKAMQDPDTKRQFINLAKVMELAKQTQGNKKRKRTDPLASTLRKRREERRRGQQPWNATRERASLRLEMQQLFQQRWQEQRNYVKKRSADVMLKKRQHLEELSRFANSTPSPPLHLFDPPLQRALLPYPVANSATIAYWWKPDVRDNVFQMLPRAVQQDSIKHQTRWEREHSTIVNQVAGAQKIPQASAAERRARLCLEAGRCMCSASVRQLRGMQLALQAALKTFMGPGSRRAGITEERRALEEGQVVLRIQRHGEPVSADKPLWLHVGLMYIDKTRPTFLRMFRHGTDCQSSDATANLTAAQKPGENHPWWLSDIEALDSLDFTAAWALDFWQVVSGLACGVADNTWAQAARSVQVQRMGIQTVIFWQGQVDLEVLDAIEGDTSPSDDDPANEMPRPPKRPPQKPLLRSQQGKGAAPLIHTAAPIIDSVPPIIDSVPPIADGDVDAKSLEERIKVARGGEKQVCKGRDGTLLEMLFTYRKVGPATPFGGFQVRCYHHEPEVRVNKAGRTYSLPCRKEIRCMDGGGQNHVLNQLIRWIRDGPSHPDRLGHQKANVDTSDSFDIETEVHSLAAQSGLARKNQPAKDISGGSSSSSSSSDNDNASVSDNDNVSVTTSLRAHRPIAAERSSTDGKLECWVCGSRHDLERCPLWMLALSRSKEDFVKESIRPLGVIQPVHDGLVLPGTSVQIADVPADGDCFFHALGMELQSKFPEARQAAGAAPQLVGPRWRAFLIKWIRGSSQALIDGTTVSEWIQSLYGTGVDTYCATMSKARGRDTWGGFFEAAVFCQAWGRNLCILMLQPLRKQWHVLAAAGYTSADATVVCLAWHNDHWQRARMKPDAHVAIQQWQSRR